MNETKSLLHALIKFITKNKKPLFFIGIALFFTLSTLLVFIQALNAPPKDFPTSTLITIKDGMPTKNIIKMLDNESVIKSSFYMYLVLRNQYPDSHVQAGIYFFEEPMTAKDVARAITGGLNGAPLNKITFPEGFRVEQINKYLPDRLKTSETASLIELEGYLFPDTYHISSHTTLNEVIEMMQQNFDAKIGSLQDEIESSDLTLAEIVTLASILEREANDYESMRIVSGILQTRLMIGMPLQVDATFEYLLGKRSDELTEEDLNIDSPFNTYTNAGLPPHPIASPGMNALNAVFNPTETDYLYYLTDADGTFHYAQTFEQHKRNKERYLY